MTGRLFLPDPGFRRERGLGLGFESHDGHAKGTARWLAESRPHGRSESCGSAPAAGAKLNAKAGHFGFRRRIGFQRLGSERPIPRTETRVLFLTTCGED
jgi:hypothetical protein